MKDIFKETYVFFCHSIPLHGSSYKEHGLGGAESALTYMAQEIAKAGKEVIVFCKTEAPGLYEGVRYERLEKFSSYIQFQIIDVFISVRSADVFLYNIKARLKVLWLHDAPDQPHMQCLDDERVRKNIDCYVTISEWQRKGFVRKFGLPEDKIFASRNGVNRKYYKILRDRRRKRLVYTSTPFRGLAVLLELFPEIRKQVPDVELYVYSSMEIYGVSREEDQERFGKIYESCKQPGIRLMGSLPQKQLARELMKARLFIYPNIFSETSCIAALEGQAAGLPVVASERGALEETVIDGATGYLIPGEGTSAAFKKSFVDTVVHLLENTKAWEVMSKKARERILRTFCWDTIAKEWITFFDTTRPTLSLCLITKDEEENVKRCMESVQPIADEVIVVDTGSHDRTKAVAQSLGAEVFDFRWCDDFSAARNFSLSKATSDWILVLDADEVIAQKDLRKVRQLLNVPEATAYLFFQRSYLNDTTVVGWKACKDEYEEEAGYSGYFDSPLTRLFRNHYDFQFEGTVHEIIEYTILRQRKAIINTDIPIHHFGKVRDKADLVRKGKLYLEIGKVKIKEHPDDPRSYYDLAAQYFELGLNNEAKEYYQKALACDKRYYRALCDLGILYAKEERYEAAVRLLEEAIEINPNYTSSYTNLGIVYEALGRIDEAIAAHKQALALDGRNVSAYRNLGLIYFTQDRNQEALECFRKVGAVDPSANLNLEYATASYKVGIAAMEESDLGKAKKCFEEAISVLPSFSRAYNNLGVLYVNSGDIAKAEEYFRKVIELTETNQKCHKECAKAYVNIGFIYNNKAEFQRALEFLEKGLEMDPANAEIYNHIGIAKCGLGKLNESVSFFEMTIRLNPNHQAAQVNLKRVKEVIVQKRNYKSSFPKK